MIGVVANARYRAIESDATADVYARPVVSPEHDPVRAQPAAVADPRTRDRERGGALDPALTFAVKSMNARVADAMWRTRVGAWLLSAFPGLALPLTAVGIFGVMAHSVTQRTAEIGVRMALGARAGNVIALMLRRASALTFVGLALGGAFALALTRLLAAMLYGVRPYDPVALGAAVMLLGSVALLACYLPARRAACIDPVVALRNE